MKNDRQIQRDVLVAIEHESSVPTGSIGVEVHHGVVKLAGRVNDSATRQSAELAARRVEGVSNVVLDMSASRC